LVAFTAIRGKTWQETRRIPARQVPKEPGDAGFAAWRKTMERAATQVATDGAFQIRRPLDALNFFRGVIAGHSLQIRCAPKIALFPECS
jgi:hypothetical protein